MKLHFGGDHAGVGLKTEMIAVARELGHEIVDHGTEGTDSVDYPDFAHAVAQAVLADPESRGVLICGTGIGVSIAANRHAGIRAALCGDVFSARSTRAHNDANVLCMGARVVGPGLARAILEAFLDGEFEGGRHARRVDKIEIDSAL